MRIIVNGHECDREASTLADLLETEGFSPEFVATAVNGEFVPRDARAGTRLNEGDAVEVVSPRQGG